MAPPSYTGLALVSPHTPPCCGRCSSFSCWQHCPRQQLCRRQPLRAPRPLARRRPDGQPLGTTMLLRQAIAFARAARIMQRLNPGPFRRVTAMPACTIRLAAQLSTFTPGAASATTPQRRLIHTGRGGSSREQSRLRPRQSFPYAPSASCLCRRPSAGLSSPSPGRMRSRSLKAWSESSTKTISSIASSSTNWFQYRLQRLLW